MKNLLTILLGLFIFMGCSKNEKEEEPDPEIPTVEDKFWGFNVQDTVGLQFLGMGSCLYLDDTCTSICGVKNGKLWIGVFDSDSKNEKFTWASSNKYDLTQIKDIGYGETITIDIKNIHISYIHVQDSKTFKMLFLSNEGIVGGSSIWNLLFVHNGKEVFYCDTKYYEVLPWNNNNLMAINGDVDPAKCALFSGSGDKLYDVETRFGNKGLVFPRNQGISMEWDYDYILQYIPINDSEFITIYKKQDSMNDYQDWYIYKGDWKNSSYIWHRLIYSTKYNARCNYNTDFDGDKLTITINTVLYSGEKSTNTFEISIETGEIIKL